MNGKSSTYRKLFRAAKKVSEELSNQLGDDFLASYVYGSLARGDYRESSDVDLHIVLKDYDQAKSIPHEKWVGSVPVGVSPHPLSFYKMQPQWILKNIDTTAEWEGLWEMKKIVVLYDPDNLVSTFKQNIASVLSNRLLLRARASISFRAAMTEASKVKEKLSEGSLDQALCYMYALGGGGEAYCGAAVHVLKTIVKISGLPLTTQRIWLRFKEACHKLNTPDIQILLEDYYGIDRLNSEKLLEIVDEMCNQINVFAMHSSVPKEMNYELGRFKLAIKEYMDRKEIDAAFVYALGVLSSYYLGLSSHGTASRDVYIIPQYVSASFYLALGQEEWQKQVHQLEELIYKTTGQQSKKELEGKARIISKAMNKTKKQLLNN